MIKIDWQPDSSTLRTFGWTGLVAFPLLGLMAWNQWLAFAPLPDGATQPMAYVLFGFGALCGILAVAAPLLLKPLFLGLSLIAVPIGFVLTYTLLTLIFFLIVTPTAILFRIVGRDALHRKIDKSATSYWTPHKAPKDVKRYFRQY